jgi:hypothetical protein
MGQNDGEAALALCLAALSQERVHGSKPLFRAANARPGYMDQNYEVQGSATLSQERDMGQNHVRYRPLQDYLDQNIGGAAMPESQQSRQWVVITGGLADSKSRGNHANHNRSDPR